MGVWESEDVRLKYKLRLKRLSGRGERRRMVIRLGRGR
jgi:hypothetical protein